MTDDGAYLGDIARPAASSDQEEAPGGVMSALALLASDQGELKAELREFRDQLGDVLTTVHQLGKSVTALSSLESRVHSLTDAVDLLLGQGDADAVRPVDLAHIPHEDRAQVLGELAAWVRDVVATGWPWIQDLLKPCWPYHPDIVNGLLWLRAAYAAAYDQPKARPHAAADWHRWLQDVMNHAAQRTKDCPEPENGHPMPPAPRDDTAVVAAMLQGRREILAETYRLMQVTAQAGYAPEQERAAQQRVQDLVNAHGITQEEFNAYVQTLT